MEIFKSATRFWQTNNSAIKPFEQRSLTITDPEANSMLQATEYYFCIIVADMNNLLTMRLKLGNHCLGGIISGSVYHFHKVSGWGILYRKRISRCSSDYTTEMQISNTSITTVSDTRHQNKVVLPKGLAETIWHVQGVCTFLLRSLDIMLDKW